MGLGLTIVDSLDTMWLMGLSDEFNKAKGWVKESLSFDNKSVSFFECTIRVLGGLMSAFELSEDQMFLDKALDVGQRLAHAFDTTTGIPNAQVDLSSGASYGPGWAGGSILAEIGTVQLEFRALSLATGKPEFNEKARKVIDLLRNMQTNPEGLYPLFISPDSGQFVGSQISFGAMGDSFYEYLLKQWFHSGRKDDVMHAFYEKTMKGMLDNLIFTTPNTKLTYIAELNGGPVHKMDHLACFAAGMLALGAKFSSDGERHLRVAKELMNTCWQMYAVQATGVAPEYVEFRPDMMNGANHNLLRPETVESLYVLWWVTGDDKYREWGWAIFQAFEKHCRVPRGYSGLRNVTSATSPDYDDTQQSFFMAETMKYLFLLFSPRDTLDLYNLHVINTEAHVLKVRA